MATVRQVCFLVPVLSLSLGTAHACNIPVFRYALERWKPDATQVVVFQQGLIDAEQLAAVQESLGKAANTEVIAVDLSAQVDADYSALWNKLSSDQQPTLPHVIVRSRLRDGASLVGWSGPLDKLSDANLITSPTRLELSRRLVRGDAIVWLFVPGSDDERNAEIRERLSRKLERLQQEIEFPDGLGLPGSELYSEVPLLMQFSVLEVNATAPDEAFLLRSLGLKGVDSGESETQARAGVVEGTSRQSGPVVIPVFGRGRVLDVVQADAFDEDLVEVLTRYLCAACSCQVKEQNPGFDLLMPTDWNFVLFGEEGKVPELSDGSKRDQPQKPVFVPIPKGRKR